MNLIDTIKAWGKSMDKDDVRFFILTATSVLTWWFFVGRQRYGTRGMR